MAELLEFPSKEDELPEVPKPTLIDVWEELTPEERAGLASMCGMPMGQMSLTKIATILKGIYYKHYWSTTQYATVSGGGGGGGSYTTSHTHGVGGAGGSITSQAYPYNPPPPQSGYTHGGMYAGQSVVPGVFGAQGTISGNQTTIGSVTSITDNTSDTGIGWMRKMMGW